MSDRRVSAIIIDTGKILLIHRVKIYNDYFVLPGGSVEKNENNIDALIREVKEETNLDVQIDKELWRINNNCDHRTQYIYLVTKHAGNLKLGTPEKERQTKDNKYFLEWHKIGDLKTVKFFPEEIKTKILKTFLGNSV